MVLVESNRRNLLRFWLCTEARVLRFDLLHLLRFRLFRLGARISLHILLASRPDLTELHPRPQPLPD